ncbi:MAG: PstS family phosphate ABC transporter substrate-binding protein [Planctomycetota bacterium]
MLSLGLMVGMLSGCFQPPDIIRIDGSSTVFPVSARVKDKFAAANPGARITVAKTGTSGGITSFVRGEIDICDASRMMSESERELAEGAGLEFSEFTVAYDGISLVVNKENDWCECLTVEQLSRLWDKNSQVQKWSDLDSSWPEEPIKLYGPDENSGTFQYFVEEILGKGKGCRTDYSPSTEDNQLVRGVQGDKYAMGYFGYAYYIENAETLNLVAVDAGEGCVRPSVESIKNDTYKPLSRPLFIYVRHDSLAKPAVASFVEFYLNEVGGLAGEVGYVAAPTEVADENLAEFQSATAGNQAEPAE